MCILLVFIYFIVQLNSHLYIKESPCQKLEQEKKEMLSPSLLFTYISCLRFSEHPTEVIGCKNGVWRELKLHNNVERSPREVSKKRPENIDISARYKGIPINMISVKAQTMKHKGNSIQTGTEIQEYILLEWSGWK